MIPISQMILRLIAAMAIGAIVGFERETAGKEAGIRTSMLVSGGSALFSMIAVSVPYLLSPNETILLEMLARNGGYLDVIANIVVGIGFLGAGIILKTESHVHGLTTAAVIWATAAIGVLVGLGLTNFAVVAALLIAGSLYLLRISDISHHIRNSKEVENSTPDQHEI